MGNRLLQQQRCTAATAHAQQLQMPASWPYRELGGLSCALLHTDLFEACLEQRLHNCRGDGHALLASEGLLGHACGNT